MPTNRLDDDAHTILRRLELHLLGGLDDNGQHHVGLIERVNTNGNRIGRLEKIVASCTAFFLGLASLVAGGWAALWFGPHK